MLNRENAPFLFTILLGLVAWTATKAIDRVVSTPLLKYELAEARRDGHREVSVLFTNVSNVLFKDLDVTLLVQDSVGSIEGTPVFSAELPMLVNQRLEPELANDSATFKVPQLHPGGRFKIAARVSDDAVPLIGVNSTAGPISPTSPSLSTWVVEHQILILVSLSLIGLAVAGVYLFVLAKAVPGEPRYEL